MKIHDFFKSFFIAVLDLFFFFSFFHSDDSDDAVEF